MEDGTDDVNRAVSIVGKNDDTTVWESRALWNDPSRNRLVKGAGVPQDFDVRGVRDTFKGRLHRLLNIIKRHL